MSMDWDKLKVFHAAAEAGSFTHAGEQLGLSQSAVSRQVSALEQELGVSLFHRHARGLILTEQGELLHHTAHDVFMKLEAARAKLTDSKERPNGELRVQTTPGIGVHWLTPRLGEFIDLYPDIHITLITTDEELDLAMREADVAIRLRQPTQPDLIQRKLFSVHFHAYASPEYLKRFGTPRVLDDLDKHRIVLLGGTVVPNYLENRRWLMEVARNGKAVKIIYDAIIDHATVVTGYRTYPHIDTYDTAHRAGEILLMAMRGRVNPVMAWGNVPMLPHVMRQGSDDHPNHELQARCAYMTTEGALAASLFTGFPHADIRNAGLSAVVVTDGDQALAERLRDELLNEAWAGREAFVYRLEPLEQSLARAKAMEAPKPGEGPIVLLDHYDNCASGGTMDTTVVLAAILRGGLDNVAAFAIYDPAAVSQAIAAGIGAEIALAIGGTQVDDVLPATFALTVTGTVKTISNGRFRNKGPMGRGVLTDMGPSVVLDTGKVEIALISRHVEPSDLNCLVALGIDPMQKRYVMLKSRIHWRAGLGAVAKAVVECAGMGVCTSDYNTLTFKNVRRPIYPLDLPNR